MLTEDSVVHITCDWLISLGWHINSRRLGTSKGDDIVAEDKLGHTLLVECKGAISPRTGNEFTNNYLWRSVSGATFNSLRAAERNKGQAMLAIALPRTKSYQHLLGDMKAFFVRNSIVIFWLEQDGVIEVWQSGNSFKAISLCHATQLGRWT